MEEIVKKVEDAPSPPPAAAGSSGGPVEINIRVSAQSLGSQKKRAEVWGETSEGDRRTSRWAMLCDEGEGVGGEDTAPAPLAYFSAGIAF